MSVKFAQQRQSHFRWRVIKKTKSFNGILN
jgi:hypothetical protein